MDFKYSEEAEAFRQEFRAWLEANPPDHGSTDDQIGEFMDDRQRGLAAPSRVASRRCMRAAGSGSRGPKPMAGAAPNSNRVSCSARNWRASRRRRWSTVWGSRWSVQP